MTKEEFYTYLQNAGLTWEDSKCSARTVIRLTLDDSVEAALGSLRCCPLTAVCYLKLGKVLTVDRYDEAAQLLGFNRAEAEDIMYLADTPPKRWSKDEPLHQALRGRYRP